MKSSIRRLICASTAFIAALLPAQAKDVSRLWFIGGSIGYHTTQDSIESNADLQGDPRPDDLVSREGDIDDTVQLGLHLGAGLSRRFTLQLETGYFRGEIGPVDVYHQEQFPYSSTGNPFLLNSIYKFEKSEPVPAGTLTQIPVSLTGILRFRPDRPLNPYIGAGGGMIFMEFERTDEFKAVNATMQGLHIGTIADENGKDLTPTWWKDRFLDFNLPALHELTFDVDDSVELHLSAGMEYALSNRFALIGEARYVWYKSSFSMTMGGHQAFGRDALTDSVDLGPEDQLNLDIMPSAMYHPDGSLKVFNTAGLSPNPRIPGDPKGTRFTCEPLGVPPGRDWEPGQIVDIDRNGLLDVCYQLPLKEIDYPGGQYIVQGGDLALDGFVVQLGMRVYF